MSRQDAPFSGAGTAAYPLRPGVHGVMVRRDLVLLDTRSDSYLCLPALGSAAIVNDALWCAPEVADQLRGEGLIGDRRRGHPYPVRPIPAPPTRACRVEQAKAISPGARLAFVSTWCALAPQRPEISDLALRMGGRTACVLDREALADRVDAFRRLLPAMPWVGACLFQSWLLLNFLKRGGHDATWVFGVRTWPFAAHCWLQVDDICLTDAPEALSAYHPVLAI